MPTTKKNNLLEYKGHPLMRKENIIYYGSMSDSHIIMMQILESSDYKGLPVAKRVSVQLQQTDPNVRMKERIVKKPRRTACGQRWILHPSGSAEHCTRSKTSPQFSAAV